MIDSDAWRAYRIGLDIRTVLIMPRLSNRIRALARALRIGNSCGTN